MKKTTLCYIENNDRYLLMFRGKKPDDPNEGKWIGIGGKIEEGETPLQCIKREVIEETGLEPPVFKFHGIVHFVSDKWEDEDMYLYSACVEGSAAVEEDHSAEGILKWIDRDRMAELPMWEGDRVFLDKLMAGHTDFEITLCYEGEKLVKVI